MFQEHLTQADHFYIYQFNNKFSYLFDYTNKRKWIPGPLLPKDVAFLHSSAIGINQTAVIFLRASPSVPFQDFVIYDYDSKDTNKMNFIYNFESQSWTRIVDMPIQLQFAYYNLPLTLDFDKNGTRLIQVLGFDEYFDVSAINDLNEVGLWTLNLSYMEWSKQKILPAKFVTYGILIIKVCL